MGEYLREASEADLDLLFDWANDPEVRKNSFSTAQISYEEHQKWFKKLMQDKARKQYIYLVDEIPAGQIRIEKTGDSAEVSYSICAEQRGKGHGRKMLDLLARQLLKEEPELSKLTAKVKEGNLASERAFLDNGYQKKCILFEFHLKEWYNR